MFRNTISTLCFILCLIIMIITVPAEAGNELHPELSPKIGPFLRKEIVASGNNHSSERRTDAARVKIITVLNSDPLQELPESLLSAFTEKVKKRGGRIGNHAYNKVQVFLPLEKTEELASFPEVRILKRPFSPGPRSVISEGKTVVNADEWQSGNLRGSGVKVGIIDLGFYGYSQLLGTELPYSLTTKMTGFYNEFYSEQHGTACAEIVHDIAPEAQMYLVNAGDYDVDFHNAVNWLSSQGVDVVSSSIGINYSIISELIYEIAYGYSFSSYYASLQLDDMDALRQQWENTIRNAVSGGITWVQAAGNDGEKRWKSEFTDTDGDGFLNFSPTENKNEILLSSYFPYGIPVYAVLAWGEGDTEDDYDLFISDEYGNNVANSTIIQAEVPFFPMEVCRFYPIPGRRYFAHVENYDAVPRTISLNIGVYGIASLQHYLPQGTVKMAPPADMENIITVGAVPFDNPHEIESYSSQGPNADDVIKPDVVAPDFVSTRTYGAEGFPGTSAAAPHAAGVCVLIKEKYPEFTPAQVKAYLEDHAQDLGTAGKDNIYGSGLVHLPAADASCIPVTENLDLHLCVTYQGSPYTFTLHYIPLREDPSGIYWKMDIPTFAPALYADESCIFVASDLDMDVCVSYAGRKYSFILEYIPLASDPSGIYWEMDVSTFSEH